ncbi:molybdenum cofactor biosynthesis protein MoaE [Zunongwangia sp. SCSIO 43204]|uniref:molybdenum cofactor biosynthesis protein MoaE n=1 Tax=Zunongwangia sp. SCSIO 43204 TaxID=2779359 RepID=UPI001CA8B433|nr:molybdenum cofactor biosynthesis protein MoaE [Zunongwangia sp. SCSIO 43204]UAB82624.1 molybdenum cofactor biosynthesis protein MoaE [Zunongwangia sp. SCSIO 43204]
MEKKIEIIENIDPSLIYKDLSHPASGGICVFIGAVRDTTQNQKVNSLFFEAYEAMALKEMEKIAAAASKQWNLNRLIMQHADGDKKVEEPVVLVGASSAHRDDCFEACRFLIDTLKEKVPIWKKEFFDGKDEVWVSPHP